MQKQYETIFIVTPIVTEGEMKGVVKKYTDFLKENKAEIVHEEAWGLQKLAYTIKKKDNGYYHIIQFKAGTELIPKFEVLFTRDENILRFMTVRLDKYGIEYSEKRRKNMAEKKSSKEVVEKEKQEL